MTSSLAALDREGHGELISLISQLDGLLGHVACCLALPSLCRLEETSRLLSSSFIQASACTEYAPLRLVAATRGFAMQLGGPPLGGEEVHRRLKRFLVAIHGAESPANWQWPLHSLEQAERLAMLVTRFRMAFQMDSKADAADRGRVHLLEFAFQPSEVQRAVSVEDARPAESSQYYGSFHPSLGVKCLLLEAFGQSMVTRQGEVSTVMYLVLRLGRPVPRNTYVKALLWSGERAGPDDDRGVLEPEDPVVAESVERLPAGCAASSLSQVVALGSPLHKALTSHGTLRALLAFAPFAG